MRGMTGRMGNSTAKRVMVVVASASAIVAGCAPGGAAEKLRPADPTAAAALGDKGSCHAIEHRGEPLVVDWKPEHRGDLEEAMHDGVAVVRYTCDGIKLMKDCRLEGSYGFLGMTRREQVVRLESADEVRANLPTLGVGIAAKIGGELGRSSTLDVALVMIGKRRTTLRDVSADDLKGSCEGATHFVHGAIVGAFVMETGTKGHVRAVADVFGAGVDAKSDSARNVRNQDGDPKDCAGAAPDSEKPPPQCGAAVRLEMIGILPKKAPDKAPVAPAADAPPPDAKPVQAKANAVEVPPEPCPAGLVFTSGKCTAPANAPSFQCEPRNFAQCDEQCTKGNAGSCGALGALYAHGHGVARDAAKGATLFKSACDGGDVPSCVNLGRLTAAGHGATKDAAAAAKLYEKACKDGDASGCALLGAALASGDGVTKDEAKAAALLKQACDGGSDAGCTLLGEMTRDGRGVTRDAKRAADLFLRACQGSLASACDALGELRETGGDPIAAGIFYARACGQLYGPACTNLARLEHAGRVQPAGDAKRHFETACTFGRDNLACAALKIAFGGAGPAFPDVARSQRWAASCDAGVARDCASSGVMDIASGAKAPGMAKLERACRMGDAWGCALQKSVH